MSSSFKSRLSSAAEHLRSSLGFISSRHARHTPIRDRRISSPRLEGSTAILNFDDGPEFTFRTSADFATPSLDLNLPGPLHFDDMYDEPDTNDVSQTDIAPSREFDTVSQDLLESTRNMNKALMKHKIESFEGRGDQNDCQNWVNVLQAEAKMLSARLRYTEELSQQMESQANRFDSIAAQRSAFDRNGQSDPTQASRHTEDSSAQSIDEQISKGQFSINPSFLRPPFDRSFETSPLPNTSPTKPLHLIYPTDTDLAFLGSNLTSGVPEMQERYPSLYSSHGEAEPDDPYHKTPLSHESLDLNDIVPINGDVCQPFTNARIASSGPEEGDASSVSSQSGNGRSFYDTLSRKTSIHESIASIDDYGSEGSFTSACSSTPSFEDILNSDQIGDLNDIDENSNSSKRKSWLRDEISAFGPAASTLGRSLRSSMSDQASRWWKSVKH
ncbi:uncharacterized protein I303_100018 [Kwoniella dejecticola CBS 10117]|uniref:Uncharacterized protein n=1 Tax=Kwoniella dejecticola CBS 10117 TaxID=1296121 RepID=A0A1A6ADR0_9TREE|nr:uncharacterized protein I303_00018 [Kwoniella dejecticola CBS 10117]OBR88207.1 hypothetical protein I303_00018 [Kwoniella dejecticola CBS 10117]